MGSAQEPIQIKTLKEPYGLVLRTLAAHNNPPFMMPERVAKTPANVQIKEYIGSGPFRFKADEWQPGHKAVFERNKDYIPRKEPPDFMSGEKVVKIDRLEWLHIPDNNTTLSALTADEIDYFEALPLEYIQVLKKNPDIVVHNVDMLGVQGLIKPHLEKAKQLFMKKTSLAMILPHKPKVFFSVHLPRGYGAIYPWSRGLSPSWISGMPISW